MQIYGLSGTGQVADIGGAIRRHDNHNMRKEAHSLAMDAEKEKQRVANTVWLAGASKFALDSMENGTYSPDVAVRLFEEGKRRGILDPTADPARFDKNGAMKVYRESVTALGGVPEQKDSRTDDIKEYEYYRRQALQSGQQPLGLTEWMERIKTAGRPTSTTNVHLPPTISAPERGYQHVMDDNQNVIRTEPIPGSGAEREIQAEQEKAANLQETAAKGGALVVEDVDRIFELASPTSRKEGWLPDIGPMSKISAKMPLFGGATEAGQIDDLIFGIKSRIGFNELQEMRNNSPTGGALGQVSNFEIEQLQSLMGRLNPYGDPAQFLYNLSRVRNRFNEVIHGRGNYQAWTAPEAAYQLLLDHADDPLYVGDFLKKYGYLPPGFHAPRGE